LLFYRNFAWNSQWNKAEQHLLTLFPGEERRTASNSNSNGQILCFEHCGKKVFSLWELPEACPGCSTHLLDCDLKIPPFAVPSPFKKALEFPCAIVIKPTKGKSLLKIET
jgi:hypothetical protein